LISSKHILENINANKSNQKVWFNYNKIIKQKEKEAEKYKQLKLDCYVDWKANNLSKEEYIFSKEKFDINIEILNNDILKLKDEFEQEEELRNNKLGWLDSIVKYGEIEELSREIIVRLVDMIYVTKGNEIKVVFKYADKFEKIKGYIEKNKEKEQGERQYAAE